jgi:hypothetical protein
MVGTKHSSHDDPWSVVGTKAWQEANNRTWATSIRNEMTTWFDIE